MGDKPKKAKKRNLLLKFLLGPTDEEIKSIQQKGLKDIRRKELLKEEEKKAKKKKAKPKQKKEK
tara:strand:+ start:4904 stop:5095 length:192 start_codon:yes stop_codon:yes gene_type:complete